MGVLVLLPYFRSYGAFSLGKHFTVNHFNLLEARMPVMAKTPSTDKEMKENNNERYNFSINSIQREF